MQTRTRKASVKKTKTIVKDTKKTTTKKAAKKSTKKTSKKQAKKSVTKAKKPSQIKSKKIKKVKKKSVKKTKAAPVVATPKKITKNESVNIVEKKQRIKRKIEDFSKFHKEREALLSKRQKSLNKQLKLDKKLIKKGVEGLKKFTIASKKKNVLFDTEDGFVYIEVTLNHLPESFSIRPFQIPLKNPIYSEDYFSKHCIFVRNPENDYKEKVEPMDIPCIGEVIGYDKLCSDHKRYENKRDLCKEYDLFFCDYKVYDLLRKPLGKFFYQRKKIPFPIDCEDKPAYSTAKDYEGYLNSLSESTYFIQGNGPNYSLKVARITMDTKQILQNVTDAITALCGHLLNAGELETENIRRVCLKTYNSPSLPVYSFLTEREKNKLSEAMENM